MWARWKYRLLQRLLPRPCNWPYSPLERLVYAFRPPKSRTPPGETYCWNRDEPFPVPFYKQGREW